MSTFRRPASFAARNFASGLSAVAAAVLTVAIASSTLAVTAAAQAFSATGVNASATGYDNSWTVSCTALTALPGQPACPTGPQAAAIVTVSPAGWHAISTATGQYISVGKDASIWADAPDENPHYQYKFSTTFDVADPAHSVVGFNILAFDNYWVSAVLNGNQTLAIGGDPLQGPGGANWASVFTLMASSGLQSHNTLDLTIQGNGRTDGVMLADYEVTSTPEPGSLALLGTGLLVLVPVARKRMKEYVNVAE
ncbi:MAG: hypothetical protein ABI194_04520 [Gemmatimonadaceae bacterium]